MSKDWSDPFTEKFFAWMESEGLKPQDIARDLNKKDQTVFNWRSRGVPKAQWIACEAVMERHNATKAEVLANTDPTFVIKPSYTQFQNWNRAALAEGKVMEDWAVDGLDAWASDAAARALAVAEKKGKYSKKKKKGRSP